MPSPHKGPSVLRPGVPGAQRAGTMNATGPVRHEVSRLSLMRWNGPRPSGGPELTEGFQSTTPECMYIWGLSE